MYICKDIIWFIENTALTLFFALNETWVYLRPQQKYESRVGIRLSCSILARSRERICHLSKSNFSHVTGGLITATIPLHVGKLSFIVLISNWWQKGRTFPGLLRSIYSLSWWSPIAPFTWGAIEYNNAQSYNICTKAFLITSVYGIVTFFYSLLSDFYLRRKLVIYAVLG